jgi:hypothetical protein
MPSVFAKALLWMLCLGAVLYAAREGPALLRRDVVNAADHSGGKVAPGEIVVLFPSNAGPTVLAGASANAEGKVPTLLGETRVLFDGIAAPIAYSVRGQVGAVVPYEIAKRKTTDVMVEYEGARSPAVTLEVVDSAPALFTLDLSGKGQAAILNETGCCSRRAIRPRAEHWHPFMQQARVRPGRWESAEMSQHIPNSPIIRCPDCRCK